MGHNMCMAITRRRLFLSIIFAVLLSAPLFVLAGGGGAGTPSENPTLAVIGQSCVSGGNYANVTFQIQGVCPVWDHDLYIDGVNYSGIDSCGSPKTVTLNHNTHYGAYGYSWSMPSTPYIYFYTYYCPAPPSVTLYRYNDGSGWNPYDTWMSWNSYLYMHWPATNADYCTTNWRGGTFSPGGVDYSVPPPSYGSGSYYYVYCYGPGGSTYDYVWVGRYAPPAPTVDLQHDLYDANWSSGTHRYMDWNQNIRIYWGSTNTTYCVGGNFNTGNATSGYVAGNLPPYNTWLTYAVTCYGPGGSVSKSFSGYRYAPPPPPTASVSANPTSRLVGQSSLVTYSSSGSATSCTLQEQAPGGSYANIQTSAGGSSSITRTLNSAGTWNYRAYCAGPGGSSSWVYTAVTVVYPNPSANLQVRKIGSSSWADSLTINPGEQIELGWNQSGSADTTSCAAVPPLYGFGTGNAISGIDNSIDEPIGNSSYIYRLLCYGQGSPATQAADTLTVTTNGGVGATFCPGTEVDFVTRGSSVDLCWQLGTNDPSMCSINAGSNPLVSSLSGTSGTYTYPEIVGEVTFTLSCQGGDSDTMTVKVLPELQET